MADDPLMKAVIVNQSVPGTVAAFKQIREKNPDIKLILLTPQEDVAMAEEAADLVIDADNISRGYRIIAAAKKMGAKKFVHISFPRHMSIETLALRRAIMEVSAMNSMPKSLAASSIIALLSARVSIIICLGKEI